MESLIGAGLQLGSQVFERTIREFSRANSNPVVRGAAPLVLASTVAQGLSLLFAPVLSRIYSPTDYGLLAVFMIIPTVATCVTMGRYELAIQLPKEDSAAAGVLFLCFGLAVLGSALLSIPCVFFARSVAMLLGNPAVTPWLKVVPIFVLLAACFQVIRSWSLRKNRFADVARATLWQSGLALVTNLTFGMFGVGALGLILGSILSQTAGLTRLCALAWQKDRGLIQSVDLASVGQAARRHWNMARTLLFCHGWSVLYGRIPLLVISNSGGAAFTGLFSLAERLATLPSQIVANAIGDSYRQHAVEAYQRQGRFEKLMLRTLALTFALAVVPFSVAIFFAPPIFAVLLGERWRAAGEIAQILLIGGFFSFVSAPVDKASVIVGKHRFLVAYHLVRGGLTLCAGLAAVRFKCDLKSFLWMVVAVQILMYSWDTIMCYRFAKGGNSIKAGDTAPVGPIVSLR